MNESSLREKLKVTYLSLSSFVVREVWILLVMLSIVLGISVFFTISNLIQAGSIQKYDELILYSFRDPQDVTIPIGPVWLKEVMRDVTSLGGGTVLTILIVNISLFLLLKKKYFAFFFVIVASLGGFFVDISLKSLFARERPDIMLHLTLVTSKSFPSGHSMMSAAIYPTLAAIIARIQGNFKIRIFVISASVVLMILIGFSRVYLGVHYPSDVIGGWTAGLTWATICWFAALYFERKNLLERVF